MALRSIAMASLRRLAILMLARPPAVLAQACRDRFSVIPRG